MSGTDLLVAFPQPAATSTCVICFACNLRVIESKNGTTPGPPGPVVDASASAAKRTWRKQRRTPAGPAGRVPNLRTATVAGGIDTYTQQRPGLRVFDDHSVRHGD